MNKNKLLLINGIFSLLQQIVSIVCGFILPAIILRKFGSNVNGVMSSITSFIAFITLLQGGVGTVARLAFYKALHSRDNYELSEAYKTVDVFFKKFSLIFGIYLVLLAILYPMFSTDEFDYWFDFSLVLVLGVSSIFEYLFGQVSQLLLYSDQKGYYYSIIQIITTILSTGLCILLVYLGFSIHIVKLVGGIVFSIRPIVLYIIVKHKYKIDYTVKSNSRILDQKYAAFIRHLAFYVHTNTDVLVLTFFTSPALVSVYAVYNLVIKSISNIVSSVLGNMEVVFGKYFADNDIDSVKLYAKVYDVFSKYFTSIFFFSTIILITPFVMIYTSKVEDANYYQPIFAIILVSAEMLYCMGLIYQNIYIAAGHIRSTQWISILEALINLIVSLVLVYFYGLIGVAIGTMAGMTFKSIANIIYLRKKVVEISIWFIFKSYLINVLPGTILTFVFFNTVIKYCSNYWYFVLFGISVFLIMLILGFIINYIFFKNEFSIILKLIKKRFIRRKNINEG